MTYLVTWKGNHQNIEIGRYADKASAKRVLDGIEDPSIGGIEVDNELDLIYPKAVLVDLFNKLGSEPPVTGFITKAEGQRQVFARIEDLGKALPLTEVIPAPETSSEAPPASEQPQEADMAAAKKTTKKAKTAKATKVKVVKLAKTNGAGKDEFGLRKGSKTSEAARLFARSNGATMAQVNEATGANQYNLLNALTEAGHKVKKDGKTFFLTAK